MENIDNDLAALLAEHRFNGYGIRNGKWLTRCTCGESFGTLLEEPEDDEALFAAHQATVIAAAGWRKGREEWGVLFEGDRWPYETSDDLDWLFDEYITGVYGEGETPPKLVRRYVTDWEEGK